MRNSRLFLAEAFDINDTRAVNDRINLYKKIIDQSAHAGERNNAQTMMDKLIAKAKAAGSYKEKPTAKPSSSQSYYDHKRPEPPMGPKEWAKVYTSVKETGYIKHIVLSRKAMEHFGILFDPHSSYGKPSIFGKNKAVVIVYQSSVIDKGEKFEVSVRTTQFSQTKDADELAKFLEAFDAKTTNPSPNAFRVIFIGHFQDDTSDKIWGWGVKGETIYQFWGGRGKKGSLKTLAKTEANMDAVNKLAKTKEAKGYRKTTAASFADWLRQILITEPKFKD